MTLPVKRTPRKVTRKQRREFLSLVAEGWTLTHAAQAAGSDRRRFWELAQDDEDFAEELELARNEGIDKLEDAIVKAAIEGWEETDVVEKGGAVVSRITKHRKRPELLTKVREWRRPPVALNAEVSFAPAVEARPVSHADFGRLMLEVGTPEILAQYPALLLEPALRSVAEEGQVVDVEAVEVTEADEVSDANGRSQVGA